MSTSPRPPTGPLLISPTVSTQWLADHLGADRLQIVAAPEPGANPTACPARLVDSLDRGATVIVYTAAAAPAVERDPAEQFASTLRDNGFDRVATLRGGRARWLAEERPADLDSLSHLVDAQPHLT